MYKTFNVYIYTDTSVCFFAGLQNLVRAVFCVSAERPAEPRQESTSFTRKLKKTVNIISKSGIGGRGGMLVGKKT